MKRALITGVTGQDGSYLAEFLLSKGYEVHGIVRKASTLQHAQSHVRVSFDLPEYTADITGMGTLRILEAIRRSGIRTRFYQASSSEMFGA